MDSMTREAEPQTQASNRHSHIRDDEPRFTKTQTTPDYSETLIKTEDGMKWIGMGFVLFSAAVVIHGLWTGQVSSANHRASWGRDRY